MQCSSANINSPLPSIVIELLVGVPTKNWDHRSETLDLRSKLSFPYYKMVSKQRVNRRVQRVRDALQNLMELHNGKDVLVSDLIPLIFNEEFFDKMANYGSYMKPLITNLFAAHASRFIGEATSQGINLSVPDFQHAQSLLSSSLPPTTDSIPPYSE